MVPSSVSDRRTGADGRPSTAASQPPPPSTPRRSPPAPSGPPRAVAPPRADAAPPRSSGPARPPRPPATAVRGDGPARSTAATIVAGTGALLLLAAAATFLAVSWDQLGVTARVAIVGAVTASAIVGGANLRRTLPAVGAVVFHLGALLLPVDALGLALQFDVGRAGTWTAVGLTAVAALPVAAWVGRSPVLAGVALAGVPTLATGLALHGSGPAPLLVAVAAIAGVAVVADRATDGDRATAASVRTAAAPALAIVAVVGPLLVTAVSRLVVAGGGAPLQAATAAGWVPTSWTEPGAAGALAVVAVAAAAAVRQSSRLAAMVPILAALAAASLLLPGDAPRLAVLLPWPLLFLAVEASATLARTDRALAGPTATAAEVVEVLAAFVLPVALYRAVTGAVADLAVHRLDRVLASPDHELALVVALGAVAWALATLRRRPATVTWVATAGAAVVTAAAAGALLSPSTPIAALVLLAGAAAALWLPTRGTAGGAASGGLLLLGTSATLAAWLLVDVRSIAAGSIVALPAAVTLFPALVAAAAAAVTSKRLDGHARGGDPEAAVVFVPVILALALTVGLTVSPVFGSLTAHLAGVAVLFGCATLVDRLGLAADGLRSVAALVALLAALDGAVGELAAAEVAVPLTAVTAAALVLEAVRTGRHRLMILAGPVAIRTVAGVAWAATGSRPATGVVLVAVAVASGLAAVATSRHRTAATVTAIVAAVPGVALLAVSPHAVAWATVGLGLAGVAGGLQTRTPVVTHTGGVVATVGVWQLLHLGGVTAADAWLAAPALHLWLAALGPRRAGRISSWAADVPPLLLVAVPAVLERATGGSGWHAMTAGGLALVAVVVGGTGRHGGPLLVGSALVTVVVLVETFAVVAAVPTWVWLAVGGLILLGAAVAIERTGGAPVAAARRLRDVIAERFD